ncbi:SDR family oxidoreductase [Nonlabens sp. Ci31]|uniref:SDR family oxidoreductase n=1 Tax=Nonlabens sp. Ci31 TaxID=2608253 RepID=UPI001462879D|nr:SDR family oxidoreductase [Nonlabens sp. Ci31]QJP34901.1 SDR family oxidoreductase [Nonlabens sp. Ci31]
MTQDKILITGAAGFIGSNLADYFVGKGYVVVGLDNFSTGHFKNIQQLKEKSNFQFIEGDIRDMEVCVKAVKGCRYVLHQAALGSVPRSIKDPITTNDVNISGFLNILTACKNEEVDKLVYAASSSTYGDSKALPKVEDQIGKPLSPYAITKYVNELYADVFYKTYGLKSIGLRYFNVFGRRQDPNGAYAAVIPKFIAHLMNRKSPIINGDGTFSRDFTYIDNVIQANELAMLSTQEESNNCVLNIAFGERTTISDLVQTLKDLLSRSTKSIQNLKINYGPNREGDVPHSLASIQKAKDVIGYDPQYSLQDGLKESIKWYQDNL